jgi:hypothetical protein
MVKRLYIGDAFEDIDIVQLTGTSHLPEEAPVVQEEKTFTFIE